MARKFSLLLAAVAVFALAVPAFAGANGEPLLTDKNSGNNVVPGTGIVGTSTNSKLATSFGNLTCAHVEIIGELTQNGEGIVTGEGGAGTATTCSINGKTFTVTNLTLNHLVSTTSGSGTIAITFEADLPNLAKPCHFSSGSGLFTYVPGQESLRLTNVDLLAMPAACEPGLLSGDFMITQLGGAAVILD